MQCAADDECPRPGRPEYDGRCWSCAPPPHQQPRTEHGQRLDLSAVEDAVTLETIAAENRAAALEGAA